MKYNEYKQLNFSKVGKDILTFWKENGVFEKSVDTRSGQPTFVFYEGPPSANGTPGIHHVMARTIKDIFCRYKTLKGFQVKRKGGWDTHGLPVELQVEKELGITKEDIGKKISVADYNRKCRETVMKYKDQWDNLTEKMGYWVDLQNPYITYDNNYIESCWHLLKMLYDKGFLYKGYTIQPFSPAAGTGLSSHELNQPGTYQDVKDTSVVAQFKIKGSANDYFLAWTTTPWTLPSNTCLVVGKDIDYVKVKTHNQYTNQPITVIFAKKLMDKVFGNKYIDRNEFDETKHKGKIPYTVVEECKGETLAGIEYDQLMPYVQPRENAENAFKVVIGDFVTTEDGTGIVHAAPTFGADDFRVAKQNNVPALTVFDEHGHEIPLVDKQGKFVKEVTDFAGMYVKNYDGKDESAADYKSTDVLISIKLKEENKAFKVEKYEHSYPHCWRTHKPILYYPLESWFIRTTAVKDRMAELNKTINWKPESTGTGRFGDWLNNLVDWNLSRSRYWGTPLPIWRTEDGKEEICIGSVAELKEHIDHSIKKGFMTQNPFYKEDQTQDGEVNVEYPNEGYDLHRPHIDEIVLVSSTGQPMRREPDLIDVWFDSGAMPYAQWHYPFENEEIFRENFPADFISEGVDQTRGWFFTLHAISSMLFDSVAFKNVVSTGLVLDEQGNKMSKSKGNVINPFETLEEYGPDATRWYMVTNAQPWDNLKFSKKGLGEVMGKFFGTLQNTYSFFALYANLDNFTFSEAEIPLTERTESDRWIISRLNSLIKQVDEAYAEYEPTKAGRAIQQFVNDDLSNWYVRLNRKRFWKGEYNQDKIAAYQTLYTCLKVVAQLASPIAPFYTEQLFRDLNAVTGQEKVESVHLTLLPVANEAHIDKKLELRMMLAQDISSLAHSIRKQYNIKVRQPLSKLYVSVTNKAFEKEMQSVADLIMSEINVKSIDYADVGEYLVKPDFKHLGKLFGARVQTVAKALQAYSKEQVEQLKKDFEDSSKAKEARKHTVKVDDQAFEISPQEVALVPKEVPGKPTTTKEFEHFEYGTYALTVALDTVITEELRQEGIARDLVNRIQNLRKDMGLDVQDKISVRLQQGEVIVNQAINNFKSYISEETQAKELKLIAELAGGNWLEIDEFKVKVEVAVEN